MFDSSSSDDEFDELEYVLNLPVRKRKVYKPRNERFLWEDLEFVTRFRLSKDLARQLVNLIETDLKAPTNKNFALTPSQQVLVTLDFYASGSFQRCVGDKAGVSKSSVSRVIYRVSQAIARKRPQLIYMPRNPLELKRTVRGFYQIASFPKVVGAIDCTHVPIQSPGGDNAENYRNRKDNFSINVQVVGNADLLINNIVARWPGGSHDSHIFNSSNVKGRLEDGEFGEFWLLGDKGYGVKPYMLTPLRNPNSRSERLYNESQIRTRNAIERLFGCWKRRFPALSMKLRVKLPKLQPIIVATAVLHNICRKMNECEAPPVNAEDSSGSSSDEGSSDEEAQGEQVGQGDARNRSALINSYFNNIRT